MKLKRAVDFVMASQIELAVVGVVCLVAGSASGFQPAAHAGWLVLSVLVLAAMAPEDTR